MSQQYATSRLQTPSPEDSTERRLPLGGPGNGAQARALGLGPSVPDIPGTGPTGVDVATWMTEGFGDEPLATTTAGQTAMNPRAASHPRHDTIEHHESVH